MSESYRNADDDMLAAFGLKPLCRLEVKLERENGQLVCPFIKNRRGVIFIREGDYIIYEEGGERHCCGEDKFSTRFKPDESA